MTMRESQSDPKVLQAGGARGLTASLTLDLLLSEHHGDFAKAQLESEEKV